MTNFPYNGNIPNPPDNPSNDVGTMQTNATSIGNIIPVDHIGFNLSNGGAHKQVQLQEVPINTIPAGLIGTGFETVYSSTAPTIGGGNSGEVFFVRGSGATGIRLTGPGTPSTTTNGYTFLPGGILLQWGKIVGQSTHWPVGTQTVNFSLSPSNVNFLNACLNVVATFIGPVSTTTGDICIISVSTTNFQWAFTGSSTSQFDGFYWIAIGF